MRHSVIRLFEVAEAENKTGEDTVALFAGVETFTVTRAEPSAQAAKKRHRSIMGGFHRITRLLLKSEPFAAAGCLSKVLLNCAAGWGICVLSPRVVTRMRK